MAPSRSILWILASILVQTVQIINAFDKTFYVDENPCKEMNKFFQCMSPGLILLPDEIGNSSNKIIIGNQSFRNSIISRGNFTKYPRVLEKFIITSSGLTEIEEGTFKAFEKIEFLTLKSNKIKYISSEAFANVNIDELDLRENLNIKFHPDAFKDSKITKLTLKKCGLEHIALSTFEHLFINGLKSLDLEGNRIAEIDSNFLFPFKSLDSLLILDNPINCKCPMKWLLDLPEKILNNNLGLKCSSPASLKDSDIPNMSKEMFDCTLPKLDQVHMDINYDDVKNLVFINFKCQAKGTENMKLKIVRIKDMNNRGFDEKYRTDVLQTSNSDTVSLLLKQPEQVPQLTYGGKKIYDDRGNIKLNPVVPENLTCLIEDTNGNFSTNFVVHWPSLMPRPKVDPIILERSLDNIEGEFFLKKKFTILEMIGAVFGTFITTIFAFICLYCIRYDSLRGCYFSCCSFRNNHDHKMFNSSQLLKDSNLTTGLLQYQNANTKSIQSSNNNNLPFTPMSQILLPPGYPSSGSDDTNNNTNSSSSAGYDHNFNATTLNKRSSYATYDALSGQNANCNSNLNNNSTYNDCQTYDLPQNNQQAIQAPTPLLPLPPLPRDNIPQIPPSSIYNQNPGAGNFFDPNQNAQLQAALTVATLSRMQNQNQQQAQSLDANLLQQQWNYLTMLQNNLTSMQK